MKTIELNKFIQRNETKQCSTQSIQVYSMKLFVHWNIVSAELVIKISQKWNLKRIVVRCHFSSNSL